jgi:hypothetical protein
MSSGSDRPRKISLSISARIVVQFINVLTMEDEELEMALAETSSSALSFF